MVLPDENRGNAPHSPSRGVAFDPGEKRGRMQNERAGVEGGKGRKLAREESEYFKARKESEYFRMRLPASTG